MGGEISGQMDIYNTGVGTELREHRAWPPPEEGGWDSPGLISHIGLINGTFVLWVWLGVVSGGSREHPDCLEHLSRGFIIHLPNSPNQLASHSPYITLDLISHSQGPCFLFLLFTFGVPLCSSMRLLGFFD